MKKQYNIPQTHIVNCAMSNDLCDTWNVNTGSGGNANDAH